MCQIDGDGPEGEDGQCLVGPTEVVPYLIETIDIGDIIPQHQYGDNKQRNTDKQTMGNAFLA